MDAHHILTPNEKLEIQQRVLAKERALHPASTIDVTVGDETDAHGKPIVKLMRVDIVVPPPPPRRKP